MELTNVDKALVIEWGARVSLELSRRGWALLWAMPDKRVLLDAIAVLVQSGWRPPESRRNESTMAGYL